MSLECEDGNIVNIGEKALAVFCVLLGNSVEVESFAAVYFGDYLILELACSGYMEKNCVWKIMENTVAWKESVITYCAFFIRSR